MCKIIMLNAETKELMIHPPVEGGTPVKLEAGIGIVLRLLTDNAIFCFKAKMLTFCKIDGFDAVKLRIIDDGEKIQRRSAFRFSCGIDITFNVIHATGQQTDRDAGLITDLSAGGAKIFSDKGLQEGYLLNISIQLGEELVVAFGEVRTRTELPSESKYKFQYGVKFAMMPESDQEKIIRHMYKLQREELKKVRPR
jgi:c-di-GMP-binding flagellar brake protein YcgR